MSDDTDFLALVWARLWAERVRTSRPRKKNVAELCVSKGLHHHTRVLSRKRELDMILNSVDRVTVYKLHRNIARNLERFGEDKKILNLAQTGGRESRLGLTIVWSLFGGEFL